MDEQEKKLVNGSDDTPAEETPAPAVQEDADEIELEKLRSAFQRELDKARAKAANAADAEKEGNETPADGKEEASPADGAAANAAEEAEDAAGEEAADAAPADGTDDGEEPEIQDLDDSAADGDEEEEADADYRTIGDDEEEDEPPKKKRRSKTWIVVLSVFIALLLILILGAYTVISMTTPSFAEFAGAYTTAKLKAKDDDAKLEAYTEALANCDEESLIRFLRQDLLENIVVLTSKTQGYTTAYSYMQANMSEEMIANPKNKDFKSFLEVSDKIDAVADSAFEVVAASVGGAATAESFKAESAAKQLDIPDIIHDGVMDALTTLANGIAAENAATDKEGLKNAYVSYIEAARAFQTLGANATGLFETITQKLYSNGFGYEAKMLISNFLSSDENYSPNAEMQAVISGLDAIAQSDIDVYSLAESAYSSKKTDEASIEKSISGSLPAEAKKCVALIVQTIAEGMEAKAEKNLTKASGRFSTATSATEELGLDCSELYKETFALFYELGDLQSAKTIADTYLTDDAADDAAEDETEDGTGKKADVNNAAVLGDFNEIYEAMNTVDEVFYPFYANYYYYGTQINKDEVLTALDALRTDDASKLLIAMVDYYTFLAYNFTEQEDAGYEALERACAALKDHPLICDRNLLQSYIQRGRYDDAKKIADEILAINVADDSANCALALILRTNNDLDGALAAAEKGVELSATYSNSADEAALCALLKKDYPTALKYASESFKNTPTMSNVCYLKLLGKFYTSPSKEDKELLSQSVKDVDDILEKNSVTLPEKIQAILDGSSSLEDVFLTEPFTY
ncbi:MAG: hypothetical protein IJJ85_07480 [Clostridia bacterium]|nr:hypothetical protein [Clostridia bacterium]